VGVIVGGDLVGAWVEGAEGGGAGGQVDAGGGGVVVVGEGGGSGGVVVEVAGVGFCGCGEEGGHFWFSVVVVVKG